MVGNHHLRKKEEEEEVFRVLDVIVHPAYDPETIDNDFALIRLHGKSKHTPLKLDDGSVSLKESQELTGVLSLYTRI